MRYRLKTKPPYRVDIIDCDDDEIELAGQLSKFTNGILENLQPHIEVPEVLLQEACADAATVVLKRMSERRNAAALGGLVVGFALGCLFVYSLCCLFALLKG